MTIELAEALAANQESMFLDFKKSFNTNAKGEWLEIIKDIVAMANSGGGILLIGLENDGTPSGFDVSSILDLDPADITNMIFAYSGYQFSAFAIKKVHKSGQDLAAFIVGDVRIPIVFTKTGNYQSQGEKTKSAFSLGSLYFRHGAKSEPCTSEDLRVFLEREIDRIKQSWLGGTQKVVEAPKDSQVLIVPTQNPVFQEDSTTSIQVVDDPNAPIVRVKEEDLGKMYPFDYDMLTKAMRDRYTDFLVNSKYHRIRKSLEGNPRYCWARFLNPNNPNSSKTFIFSRNFFEEFDKHYTMKNL